MIHSYRSFRLFFILTFQLLGVSGSAQEIVSFTKDIQPLLNKRCSVCHACYQSACKVKTNSWEGIRRGLDPIHRVYNNRRFSSAPTTRLFQDAEIGDEAAWRLMGFSPIIRRSENPSENIKKSYIFQLVNQRANFPYNDGLELAEESRQCKPTMKELKQHLDVNPNYGMPYGLPPLDDSEIGLIATWTEQGSQGPSEEEQRSKWAPSNDVLPHLKSWEDFFNKKDLRHRLVSRYIYEHLFMANINFDPSKREFYRLVRSRSQCSPETGGENLTEVRTRSPFGDPIKRLKLVSNWDKKIERKRRSKIKIDGSYPKRDSMVTKRINESYNAFSYCFRKVVAEVPTKSHMLYHLNDQKLARYQHLFFNDKSWQVSSLPGFVNEVPGESSDNANPFLVFQDIPAEARYRFLLDDSEYIVRTFIRGPVCRGGTAVNSIDEQFFLFFMDPKADPFVQNKNYARSTYEKLRLPSHYGRDIDGYLSKIGLVQLPTFLSRLENENSSYRRLRAKAHRERFNEGGQGGYKISDLWRGNTSQPTSNSVLTVLRHFDSASVHGGALGTVPKTMLVLDYPIMERFVYNLAVGFDVFGDLGHQAMSRFYMGFLRVEAEENFLRFMPAENNFRVNLRNDWYKKTTGIGTWLLNQICDGESGSLIDRCKPLYNTNLNSAVIYPRSEMNSLNNSDEFGRSEKVSFVKQALHHLGANQKNGMVDQALARQIFPKNEVKSSDTVLSNLLDLGEDRFAEHNPYVQFLPSLTYILVEVEDKDKNSDRVFSLVRHKAHNNIYLISGEEERRRPDRDKLLVAEGFLGNYPNLFFVVPHIKVKGFVAALQSVTTKTEYLQLVKEYGRTQTDPRFWTAYDAISKVSVPKSPDKPYFLKGGLVDLNRYGIGPNEKPEDALGEKLRDL